MEKFRLVPKTGQLEYVMKWSGDSELVRNEGPAHFRPRDRDAAAGRSDERAGALT